MEIHYQTWFADLRNPGTTSKTDFRFGRDMVNLQAHLLRMGYIVVERDDNQSCLSCTELTLVRARCHNSMTSSVGAVRNTAAITTPEAAAATATTNVITIDASEILMERALTPIYNPNVTDP